MPRVRITTMFEEADVGWSESIHTLLTDPDGLRTLVEAYINTRTAFLTTSAKVIDVRVSDDEVFRDIIVPIPAMPRSGQFAGRAATASASLLLKLFTGDARINRNMFLRGLPAVLLDGRVYTPSGLFDTALGIYRTLVQGGRFVVVAQDRTQPKQAIQSITSAGVAQLVAGSPGFANGDNVKLLGVPRSIVKGRKFQVFNATTPLSFSIRPWVTGELLGTQGFLRKLLFVTPAITASNPVDIGERRVGRPFGLPRGRVAPVR